MRAKCVLRKTAVLIVNSFIDCRRSFSSSFHDPSTGRALRWRCQSSRRVASLSFSCRSDNFCRFAFDKIADRERFLGGILTVYRQVCCNDNFFHALAKQQSVCDVTIGDATMSRRRMTSRSTDERQQRLRLGHRLPKMSPVAIPK